MAVAAPARVAAFEALRAVLANRLDLPEALARTRLHLADERDRSLAAEIAAGTLRWLAALDAVIEACAGRRVQRLDEEILDILRLSAYQLLHLDRIPPSAVVHDAVELARRSRKRSAAGLVNAVLRRIGREKEHLPLPARPDPALGQAALALDYLAVTLSHPRWLAERWLARVGFEAAEAWERFDNQPARLTLRANTIKTDVPSLAAALAAHGVVAERARFAPDGLVVVSGNPLRTPIADEGLFVVQDEASQLVALAAGVQPGERVLDACAAPGGKTVAMAGEMADRGLLVAADLRPRRLDLLRETIRRAGARSVRIARADASHALPFPAVFDCVLLDAPCTGLGTIRRDPEIRWRRGPDDLARFSAAQDRMLERASRVVRPGGRLVYATCSSEPEENEDRVSAFLVRHPDFAVASPAEGGGPRAEVLRPVVNRQGFLRTWPYEHGLEAFFAAVLVRGPGRGRP